MVGRTTLVLEVLMLVIISRFSGCGRPPEEPVQVARHEDVCVGRCDNRRDVRFGSHWLYRA